MSKSNSSTRSNSMETPAECESEVCSPQSNVPAIMEAAEGQEVVPSSPPPTYEYVLKEVAEKNSPLLTQHIKTVEGDDDKVREECGRIQVLDEARSVTPQLWALHQEINSTTTIVKKLLVEAGEDIKPSKRKVNKPVCLQQTHSQIMSDLFNSAESDFRSRNLVNDGKDDFRLVNTQIVRSRNVEGASPNNSKYLDLALEQMPKRKNYAKTDLKKRLKAQAGASSPVNPMKGPEIMHKSSKELYRAVAKQFGITCKMSDQCRCFDCQGHYFDCEYEQNEQEKTDGGLGAGTPVFISEVMQGTACTIL